MFKDIPEKQKHALWSFVELLCQYFKTKKADLSLEHCVDRHWFIENRQRVGCLPNVSGAEEEFVNWFDSLEKGDQGVWIKFLADLANAEVSGHMYGEVKSHSPFVGKLIVVRKSFDGMVELSQYEGQALMKNVFPVDRGETFLVFSLVKEAVIYPRF